MANPGLRRLTIIILYTTIVSGDRICGSSQHYAGIEAGKPVATIARGEEKMANPGNPNTRMLFAVAKALRCVSGSFVEPDDILNAVFFDSIWPEFVWWHRDQNTAHEAQERFIVAIKCYAEEMMVRGRINLDIDVAEARLVFAGISPRCKLPSMKSVRTLLDAYIECARSSRGPRPGFREISPRKRWAIAHRLHRRKYERTSIEIADRYFTRPDVLPPGSNEIMGKRRNRRVPQFIRVYDPSKLLSGLKIYREMKAGGASEGMLSHTARDVRLSSQRMLGVPCREARLP